MLLVYEDEEHLDRLLPPELLQGAGGIPARAFAYGDLWDIYILPAELGQEIADALGGELIEAP